MVYCKASALTVVCAAEILQIQRYRLERVLPQALRLPRSLLQKESGRYGLIPAQQKCSDEGDMCILTVDLAATHLPISKLLSASPGRAGLASAAGPSLASARIIRLMPLPGGRLPTSHGSSRPESFAPGSEASLELGLVALGEVGLVS